MRRMINAALLTASSLLALSAHAQETDEEIVVTATRLPTPVRDLPADVTVIDAEAALARGQATLAQALEETPGLGVVPSGGAGQQTSLFVGGANSSHTLVLFDGLRINDPSTPNSVFDVGQDQINALARVEIVEGPMSAVFGSDAIGGAVNMIPRRGGEGRLNARLDLAAGSHDTMSGAAGIDGALGHLRYALTAEGYATGGHDLVPERIIMHTGDEDGAEMAAVTAVFDLALGERMALDLLVRHRQARADFDAFLFDVLFNEYRADDPDLEISRNDLSLARLGATWNVSDSFSLRATAGGMNQDRAQRDGGLVTDTFAGERRFADLTLDWRAGALGAFEAMALVAGVFGEHEEIDVAQGFGFPPPSFLTSAEQDQAGAFVTAQGRLGPASLTAAVRADEFEGFGSRTTWRFGASFNLSDTTRFYGAYGTSFRAPTLYERFVSFGNPNLEPERGETWEVGVNAHLAAFDRPHGIETAVVYRATGLEDMIDFGPFFTYANVDLAEIETVEARLAVRPMSWLTLRAAYTHTDTLDVVAGTPLLRRPEDGWSAAAEIARGGVTGRLSWRQVGARRDFLYGDDGYAIGQGAAPAYDLVRLSGAFDVNPQVQLYVAIDNALDEIYEPVNGFAGAPASALFGLRFRTERSIDRAD